MRVLNTRKLTGKLLPGLIATIFGNLAPGLAAGQNAAKADFSTCAELNGWNNGEQFPDQVCATMASIDEIGPALVSLKRQGQTLAELSGESYIHPGGTSCNRHTGDCHSYDPYLAIKIQDSALVIDLTVHRGRPIQVSGTVAMPLYHTTQYATGI